VGGVPPYGPLDAQVVIVGEAPGREELEQGRPFCGATGIWLRRELALQNVDPDSCYWTNTVRVNPGDFPGGRAGAQLLLEWAPLLDDEMRSLHRCKVLVLCGGAALRRFTGHTNIAVWQGSVLRPADITGPVILHQGKSETITWPLVLPATCQYVIPMLHPAGMMYTKSRKDTVVLKRAVEKVGLAVADALRGVEWTGRYGIAPGQVREAIYG